MKSAAKRNPARSLESIADELRRAVKRMKFGPPVAHVYCPIDYAHENYFEYLRRYGKGHPEVVLVGMNPGPWGMTQTGVPFGEVDYVREWLGIHGKVRPPRRVHPKVPVLGFNCHRHEVSGQRVWGWAKATFGTPEKFFKRFFIANYCPLIFLEASGRNRTPDKLPAREREPLLAACDKALRKTIEVLSPKFVIGMGVFAESRARIALKGLDVCIGRIPHPSPASPQANNNWGRQVAQKLAELGIQCSDKDPYVLPH